MKDIKNNRVWLMHGDCIERMKEINDKALSLIIADIPYGEVNQKSSGLRKLDRKEADTCDIDLSVMISECLRICTGSFYIFCGTQQISEIVSLFKAKKITTRVGCWEKSNPSPMNGTRLWLSGLEFCVFARKPNATFNIHCKKALWKFPVGRSNIHPTQKPTQLIDHLVEASSNIGDTVLDFTMGSGTTGVSCMNLGRKFIGIEKDKQHYTTSKSRIREAYRNTK